MFLVSRTSSTAIYRALLVVMFGAVFSVSTASAQSKTEVSRGVVLQDAPIFLMPDASRTPLRVAAAGTNLEVLGTENGWLNVRFQDPQLGPRVGYIETKAVRQETPAHLRPLDLSIPEPQHSAVASTRVDQRSGLAQATVPAGLAATPGVSSPARHGWWTTIGLGYGSGGCRDCTDRLNGLAGDFGIGTTLSPRLRLGFGSSGWTRSEADMVFYDYWPHDAKHTLTVSTLDARLRFYPKVSSGFFVTGGLGLGMISAKTTVYDDSGEKLDSASETKLGTGAVLGIGWDINVAKHVSVTPSYTGFAMQSRVKSVNANVGQIGVGITIH
jgi:opacity protein-like surface antigen